MIPTPTHFLHEYDCKIYINYKLFIKSSFAQLLTDKRRDNISVLVAGKTLKPKLIGAEACPVFNLLGLAEKYTHMTEGDYFGVLGVRLKT